MSRWSLPWRCSAETSVRQLMKHAPHAVDVQRTGRLGRPSHVLHEIDALHELHREEAVRALDDQLVERHQVAMGDIGEAAELPLEVIDVGRPGAPQRLQGDDLIASAIVHLVDDAHAAGAEGPQDRESFRSAELVRMGCGVRARRRSVIVSGEQTGRPPAPRGSRRRTREPIPAARPPGACSRRRGRCRRETRRARRHRAPSRRGRCRRPAASARDPLPRARPRAS